MARPPEDPPTPTPPDARPALALVHEGWGHLRLQRPLAAWASWQRALRIDPDDHAAREALARLDVAEDLPAAARAVYRFRPPRGDERRARWDEAFRGRDMEDLHVAAGAFGSLADADPVDAPARYNQALCLAWLGENASAIEALDLAVRAEAAESPEAAVEAWALAEILRQGGGAEHLADDLSHTLTLAWPADEGDPIAWISSFAELRPVPAPIDPISGRATVPDARVFEWLDRPMPAPAETLTADDLPRVRATVIAAPGSLRFSSPDRVSIEGVERDLGCALADRERSFDRRSTPLPLALMDAAVWLFRLPDGLDEPTRHRLTREAVERYFEDHWIFALRRGLGGLLETSESAESPRYASMVAAGSIKDDVTNGEETTAARAKLAAVIRVREQLAARPRVAALYCGYPFDRLRRRLGLTPIDPTMIEPGDVSCMSAEELEQLDPTALDDVTLIDAYRSARYLCGGEICAKLARAIAGRDPSALVRVAFPQLAKAVVSSALSSQGLDEAMSWIDRISALDREVNGGRNLGRIDLMRGEILALEDEIDAAVQQYCSIAERFPDDSQLIMDAAASLVSMDKEQEAVPLLRRVIGAAGPSGDRVNEGFARSWLAALDRRGIR